MPFRQIKQMERDSFTIKVWLTSLLAGAGEIMFQKSVLTGGLFLLGIALNSLIMALGAIMGLLAATTTAKLSGYDVVEIKDGLYGFNGALVGIAILFFFPPGVLAVILLVLGSALSSMIMHAMRRHIRLPPYTAPFVLAT